jgi:hypothetical protein
MTLRTLAGPRPTRQQNAVSPNFRCLVCFVDRTTSEERGIFVAPQPKKNVQPRRGGIVAGGQKYRS